MEMTDADVGKPARQGSMATRRVNICFHGIGVLEREREPGESSYWVTPGQFRQLIDEIATWPNARITFDDGNASDLDTALPILLERSLDATFFPLAGRMGQAGSLSAEGIAELVASGMRVGSHGMHHVPWLRLGHRDAETELVRAREQLVAVTGHPVEIAAVPLGRYDRHSLRLLKELGYTRVYTSDQRSTSDDAWLQPRFSVRAHDTPQRLRARIAAAEALPVRLAGRVKGWVKRRR